MSAIKLIKPLQKFLSSFEAFLKAQQNLIAEQPTYYDPSLQAFNLIFSLNIAHTQKRLDHAFAVLTTNPDHEAATCKVMEYAARVKYCLEHMHLRAKLRSLGALSQRTVPAFILAEEQYMQALIAELKAMVGSIRYQQLGEPLKNWLDKEWLIKESEQHQALAQQALAEAQKSLSPEIGTEVKKLAERAIQMETNHRQRLIFSETCTTTTSFSAIERFKPSSQRAKL